MQQQVESGPSCREKPKKHWLETARQTYFHTFNQLLFPTALCGSSALQIKSCYFSNCFILCLQLILHSYRPDRCTCDFLCRTKGLAVILKGLLFALCKAKVRQLSHCHMSSISNPGASKHYPSNTEPGQFEHLQHDPSLESMPL